MEMRKIYQEDVLYEGLFRMDEFWRVYHRFLNENGYFNLEKRSEEKLYKDGKFFFIETRPFKKISDYIRFEIVFDLQVKELVDKTLTVDGHAQQYQHGKIDLSLKGVIQTDWRGRYENKAFLYLLRTLTDRFIKRNEFSSAQGQLFSDCDRLKDELKGYLNMHRFKTTKVAQEPYAPAGHAVRKGEGGTVVLQAIVVHEGKVLMLRGHETVLETDEKWHCLSCPLEDREQVRREVLTTLDRQAGIAQGQIKRILYGDEVEIEQEGERITISPALVELSELPELRLAKQAEHKWVAPKDLREFDIDSAFIAAAEQLPLEHKG